MRAMKFILLFVGLALIGLAAGFFTGQPWALALWPLAESRLSYAFIAALLAGAAAPLIWIALTDELGGLAGYGLGFGMMCAGLAAASAALFFENRELALGWFAGAMGLLCLWCVLAFFNTHGYARMGPSSPRLLRLAFTLQALVLLGAGALLVMRLPGVLPWQVSSDASVLYGCVFTGLAFFYLYAVFNPSWVNAFGPLLGFLVYDLVLSVPLFTRSGQLPSEELRAQLAVSGIILFSAALGLYYLFLNPGTRLILRPQQDTR